MTVVLTALAVMVSATLIQHLGLAEAVSKVIEKVTSCNQCFVFWSVVAAMQYNGSDVVITVMLSILSAYLSNWFVLLLIYLQRLFDKIYGEEREEGE